ncbi:hypothetical protein KKD62_03000 [Patescibacteria group bacterium]|nr:hypothetical protein [Patescibacteria group bacterium]MBU1931500.1 hypothetical protein [Patescibacteria group bacterium]
MTFQPGQIIKTEACPVCQGKGCTSCGQFGMTGQLENQKLVFNLPGFFDLATHQYHKKTALIRRIILILTAILLIIVSWKLIL